MHNLSLYHIGVADEVLGTGKRLVFWLAGCPFICYNCIEEKLRDKNSGKIMPAEKVYDLCKSELPEVDGVTFSGGEPLSQSEALIELFEFFPAKTDKILFTGYDPNELTSIQKKCYDQFDLAVTGRFENDKRGNFLWRGSSNKKFHSPSGKYSEEYLRELYSKKSAGLEITVSDGEMLFYGIPTEKDEIDEVKQFLLKNEVSMP